MRNENPVAIRDRASSRVRRMTAFAIAGATALSAAFAGLAAGSTHFKSSSKHPAATPRTSTKTRTKPKPAPKTVTAPVPSLTPNGSGATPPSQSQPAQQQPTQVTPATQPPVVVSGGS